MKNEFYLILAITLIACNPNLSKRGLEFTHDKKIEFGGYAYLRSAVKEPETVFALGIDDYPYEYLPQNLIYLNNLSYFGVEGSYGLNWDHAKTLINGFDKVEYLWFYNTGFSDLPFDVDSLSRLKKVFLDDLKKINVKEAIDELSKSSSLEILALYKLPYSEIPESIVNCENLKEIYFGSNQELNFEQHFDVFKKIKNLETLVINDKNIVDLPDNFVELDLKYLSFGGCTNLDYSRALGQAKSFERLNTLGITNSTIVELPNTIREFKELKHLYLRGNRQLNLDSLSEDLAYLPNLETLDLASSDPNPSKKPNTPRYIPENIRGLKKLKTLRIDGFRYQDIDQIGSVCRDLPNLEELSIPYMTEHKTRNRLVSLPENFFDDSFEKLKILNVSQNRTGIFDSLEVLPPSITHLYLNQIYYEEFPKIVYTLPDLQSLELRENELTSLPSDISQLESLVHLDLGQNQLEDLPDEIAQLKNLKFLHLDENPLVDDTEKVARIKALLPNTIISFYE